MDITNICPFCGCTDIGVKDSVSEEQCWAYCRRCQATGPKVPIPKELEITPEEIIFYAMDRWKQRI